MQTLNGRISLKRGMKIIVTRGYYDGAVGQIIGDPDYKGNFRVMLKEKVFWFIYKTQIVNINGNYMEPAPKIQLY